MNDKRTFPRKRKRLLASFEVDGRAVAGFTLDLSHTGLLISSFHLPKLGQPLRVTLQLPSGKRIEVAGKVARARRLPAALAEGTGSVFGLALEGYVEEYFRMVSALD